MRLTRYTDYAMRVLLYLGARPGISQNHLTKVVHDLGKAGYVLSVRGRFGGIQLARPAADINLGEVIRHTEEGLISSIARTALSHRSAA